MKVLVQIYPEHDNQASTTDAKKVRKQSFLFVSRCLQGAFFDAKGQCLLRE